MQEFLLTIAKKDLETLATIRCIAGLKAAIDNSQIWLRGMEGAEQLEKLIHQLPVKQRFHPDKNELLFPAGTITPVGKLAEMEWVELTELIPVELPVSTGVGEIPLPVAIRLQPSADVQKSAGLLTDLATWKVYAETASVVRLNALKFAVSENNEVMIVGDRLPSIPGREYWNCNGMLLPAGFEFEIPLIAEFLPGKLNRERDSMVVFNTTGEWYKIDLNFFIPAMRSAVRMTKMNVEE
jgi:hypothetical protein